MYRISLMVFWFSCLMVGSPGLPTWAQDPLSDSAFEFDSEQKRRLARWRARQPASTILGEPITHESDDAKLQEAGEALPQGRAWINLLPTVSHRFTSEHTVSVGSGFRDNVRHVAANGTKALLLGIETQHLFMPRYTKLDQWKWAILSGTRVCWSQDLDDVLYHVRLKTPVEFSLSRLFQLRLPFMVQVQRTVRWDTIVPDLPYLEANTAYFDLAPQFYVQYRPWNVMQIRVGIPFSWHVPLTKARTLANTELDVRSQFMEYGPGVYFNMPVHPDIRIKLGGAYLFREFKEFPLISQVPLTLSENELSQRHWRFLALLDLTLAPNLLFWIRGRYHRLTSADSPIYDFWAFSVSAQMQWRIGRFRIMPSASFFKRSFETLTYPLPDLSALSTNEKREWLLGLGIKIVYEFEFRNLESFFLTLAGRYTLAKNDFEFESTTLYDSLADSSMLDFHLSLGVFI